MIDIGIIGLGRIGKRHADNISKLAKLSFVCDVNKDSLDEYDCEKYSSVDEVIDKNPNADLVAICTPNGLHCDHSLRMLENNYNVLVEKPMALKTSDCLKMIKVAEKFNKRLFVVKQNRFNPAVDVVKQLLENKKLGKIYSFHLSCIWNRNADYYLDSWKGSFSLDGGTLYTQFSHFIDLIVWFFGSLEKCNGYSSRFDDSREIEFEDTGVVSLKMESGVLGSLHYSVNSYEQNLEGGLLILGEKGSIKIGGQYLNEIEYFNVHDELQPEYDRSRTANNYGKYIGSMSNHDKVYENAIGVLTSGKSISTSNIEGLLTIDAIERIYEEIRTK